MWQPGSMQGDEQNEANDTDTNAQEQRMGQDRSCYLLLWYPCPPNAARSLVDATIFQAFFDSSRPCQIPFMPLYTKPELSRARAVARTLLRLFCLWPSVTGASRSHSKIVDATPRTPSISSSEFEQHRLETSSAITSLGILLL